PPAAGSFGEGRQLLALARPFLQELLPARIHSGYEPRDAFVSRRRSAEDQVVQDFPVEGAAEPPVVTRAERKTAPQRDPLRRFIDGIGLDLAAGDLLVVGVARLDRHEPVARPAVPVVVLVARAP